MAPAIPPEHRIPDSLLAHDDITLAEKTLHQNTGKEELNVISEDVSKDNNKETSEIQDINGIDSTGKLLKQNGNNETEVENIDVMSPVNKADDVNDVSNNSRSPGSKTSRLLKSAESDSVEDESTHTRTVTKAKTQLLKRLKPKCAKNLKESKSHSDQSSPVSSMQGSRRRSRRTPHLPVRLAESEVFVSKKRSSSSLEGAFVEVKRAKTEHNANEENEAERSDQSGVYAQDLTEAPPSSSGAGLIKIQKKRKTRKNKSREAEGEDNTENEKPKVKVEKTLSCPLCNQLMREYENVFDHVKKQHGDHAEYESHLSDLKVRDYVRL